MLSDYYSEAASRSLHAAFDWIIGQGWLLTLGLFVTSCFALWLFIHLVHLRKPRVQRASAMRTLRTQVIDGAIALIGGTILMTFGLFIWFFIHDAPNQVAAAKKIANDYLIVIQGPDGAGGLRKQLADAQKGIEVEEAMIKVLRDAPPKVVMQPAPKTAAPVSASSVHASVEATKADLAALSQERGDGSPEHPALTEADCPPGTRSYLNDVEADDNKGGGFKISTDSHICIINSRAKGNEGPGFTFETPKQ